MPNPSETRKSLLYQKYSFGEDSDGDDMGDNPPTDTIDLSTEEGPTFADKAAGDESMKRFSLPA